MRLNSKTESGYAVATWDLNEGRDLVITWSPNLIIWLMFNICIGVLYLHSKVKERVYLNEVDKDLGKTLIWISRIKSVFYPLLLCIVYWLLDIGTWTMNIDDTKLQLIRTAGNKLLRSLIMWRTWNKIVTKLDLTNTKVHKLDYSIRLSIWWKIRPF